MPWKTELTSQKWLWWSCKHLCDIDVCQEWIKWLHKTWSWKQQRVLVVKLWSQPRTHPPIPCMWGWDWHSHIHIVSVPAASSGSVLSGCRYQTAGGERSNGSFLSTQFLWGSSQHLQVVLASHCSHPGPLRHTSRSLQHHPQRPGLSFPRTPTSLLGSHNPSLPSVSSSLMMISWLVPVWYQLGTMIPTWYQAWSPVSWGWFGCVSGPECITEQLASAKWNVRNPCHAVALWVIRLSPEVDGDEASKSRLLHLPR